jgi:hypothetical protein
MQPANSTELQLYGMVISTDTLNGGIGSDAAETSSGVIPALGIRHHSMMHTGVGIARAVDQHERKAAAKPLFSQDKPCPAEQIPCYLQNREILLSNCNYGQNKHKKEVKRHITGNFLISLSRRSSPPPAAGSGRGFLPESALKRGP